MKTQIETIDRHCGYLFGLFGVLVVSEGKLVLMSRRPTGHPPSSRTHLSNKENIQVKRNVLEPKVPINYAYGDRCPG